MQLKLWLAAAAAALTATVGTAAQAYPDQPIVIIVPTQVGGNVDAMARLFARAIEEEKLLPVPVVIKNMPGSGGVLGMRELRGAKPDGYTIGLWNLSIAASKTLGVSDFGFDAFKILAQTGSEATVIATKVGSKFKSLKEVVEQSKAQPGSVLDATNIGTLPFFSTLVLAQKAGVRFRPVQAGGGSERLKSVLGGHAEAAIAYVDLVKHHVAAGNLRVIGIMADERVPQFPDVPTLKEQGIAVDNSWQQFRGIIGPKGVPADVKAKFGKAVDEVLKSPDLQKYFTESALVSAYMPADQFGDYAKQHDKLTKEWMETLQIK